MIRQTNAGADVHRIDGTDRKAVRYGTGNDDRGNYEWWQIQVNNCRVTWEVR
ncbi:hypothetical protein LED50_28425 [Salmonella enterica]|nr:hypothetical protein [Salmonella enterica]